MIEIRNLSYEIKGQKIINDLSFSIGSKERIGLVGPNGTGKSTLLKIIAGLLEPTEGIINNPKKSLICYAPQEFSREDNNKSIWEVYQNYTDRPLKYEMESALSKIGLNNIPLSRRVGTLSGGQKSKLILALIEISGADVLLLDEPTNNLDLSGLKYLEEYINSSPSSFIVVSHDRRFLKNTVNKIIYIDKRYDKFKIFPSGYDEMQKYRQAEKEKQEKDYNNFITEKNRLENAYKLQKSRALAASKSRKLKDNDKGAFKSRRQKASNRLMSSAKAIEARLDRIDVAQKPETPLDLNYAFAQNATHLGSDIAKLESVNFKYDDTGIIIGPISLSIHRGDKIIILGDNGTGKSTIIKGLMKKIVPTSGSLSVGPSVSFGLIDQDQTLPSPNETILQNFKLLSGLGKNDTKTEGKYREILYRFGIDANANTRGKELSPGERTRVILAALAIKGCNVLILDEPTNHLDIEASEELEQALKNYRGSYIVISHDREFIDNIGANKTYILDCDGIKEKF